MPAELTAPSASFILHSAFECKLVLSALFCPFKVALGLLQTKASLEKLELENLVSVSSALLGIPDL